MKGFSSLIILIFIFSTLTRAEEPIRFVIRVDDIQSRNMVMLPRSILDFEEAVSARGAKVSWAVIPHRLVESQNLDGILKGELRTSAARGHEIVMHGYNHICPLCGSSGHEMYCATYNQALDYGQQRQLVIDGMQILSDSLDCQPAAFVPPGHHADETTWQVLVDEDFKWFSGTGPTRTMIYDSLYNLAPHGEFTWYLAPDNYESKLQDALADVARRGENDGYYCLLLHDPFIRKGYENGLVIDWTAELLDSLLGRYGHRLRFMTLSAAAESFNIPAMVRKDGIDVPAADFRLYPNYPNPFNAVTTIRYTVGSRRAVTQPDQTFINPQTSVYVELDVFNVTGQKIKILISEYQTAGEYMVRWDAGDVSSGIYYITLSTAQEGAGGGIHSVSQSCLLIK